MSEQPIRLTQYSHGAGCGCKISPAVLSEILKSDIPPLVDRNLLVGNDTRDDAAVYRINDSQSIISTTDFFMPIVDDPITFGRIAATNAMSDVYAMGGKPVMAIAILGWPVDKLSPEVAQQVVEGGRIACRNAGISLAGGHSIDAPEPIFGLAVTGIVETDKIKTNSNAKEGDALFLTKPIGIGVYTTAQKQGKLTDKDYEEVIDAMTGLNTIGATISDFEFVHAITDVTGFGLAGHLIEMCQGAGTSAKINLNAVPKLKNLLRYIEQGCVPGGVGRNFASYGEHLQKLGNVEQTILCDPQTSGGLLVAVDTSNKAEFIKYCSQANVEAFEIGEMLAKQEPTITVNNE